MKNLLATVSIFTFVSVFVFMTTVVGSKSQAQDMGMDGGFGLGGGMGGPGGMAEPSPLDQAKAALKKAKTLAESKSAKQKIKQIVSAKYDAYLADNQRELNSMQRRLADLMAKLELRKQARSRMIEFEIMRIENEMTGLTWPSTDSNDSPGMMGGLGDGSMGGGPGSGLGGGMDEMGGGMGGMMEGFGSPSIPIDHQRKSLQAIGEAFHHYESIHKHLPARSINDKSGKPLLSWRVTLLPMIGEVELYNRFKLDEPWDSSHNRKLLQRIPFIYLDGMNNQNQRDGLTRIQIPTGKGAILSGDSPTKFSDVRDGNSNTLLALQVGQKHAIHWTKPSDWEYDSANIFEKIEPQAGLKILVLMADGSTKEVDTAKSSEKEILEMVQIADKNPVPKQ